MRQLKDRRAGRREVEGGRKLLWIHRAQSVDLISSPARGVSMHTAQSRLNRSRQLRQRGSRQPLVGFKVLCLSFCNDVRRQGRSGRRLVPVESLQVIAHELLVEARLTLTRLILVRRPEAR